MANLYELVDRWNDSTALFTAIRMDVTDTASAAGSRLLDLLVGGMPKFRVAKDGTASVYNPFGYTDEGNHERLDIGYDAGPGMFTLTAQEPGTGGPRGIQIKAGNTREIRLVVGTTTVGAFAANWASDLGSLLPRAGGYDLGSGGSPWRDLNVNRNVTLTGLPTTDPLVVGRLWNSAGTVKVSAG